MTKRILVTGAMGNVGREVVRALRARGIDIRAAVSSVASAEQYWNGEVESVRFDFRDAATWSAALEGCTGVFLLRPPPIADVEKTLNPFVDVAREKKADHIVFLSVAGAGENKIIPHHKVEMHLKASGAAYTLLRPGFFAQNLQDAYLQDIREADRLYVPAGKGRAAFVDLYDVAEVAVEAFVAPEKHANQAYTLTGSEAIGFDDVANILSDVLGRTIRYQAASVVGYVWHLRRRGLPWGQCIVQTILHVGLRFGHAEQVDPTLEALLGRRGRTMRMYVEANQGLWRKPSVKPQ